MGIEPGTSVSAARNSDHKTTEAVYYDRHTIHKSHFFLTGRGKLAVTALFSPKHSATKKKHNLFCDNREE
jgi:hypothetical protein